MASPQYQHQHHDTQRDDGADAPEAVNMLSPTSPASNLEAELQGKYQSAHGLNHATHQSPPLSPSAGDSDKEVVSAEHDHSAKYVVPAELKSQYPEAAIIESPQSPWTATGSEHTYHHAQAMSDSAPEALPPGHAGDANRNKKILGMSRKVFFILVAVLAVIIVAAVGGGVGGAVASSHKTNATPATSSTDTPGPLSTASSTGASTTTNPPLPQATVQFLNNETWPLGNNFAFQGWSRPNFTGVATQIVTGDGANSFATDFQIDLHSYIWKKNMGNCCVNLCANSTKEGYLGYRCTDSLRNQTSGGVQANRAYIWCNDHPSDDMAASRGCSN